MSNHDDAEVSEDDVMALFAAADPAADDEVTTRRPVPEWTDIERRAETIVPAESVIELSTGVEHEPRRRGTPWVLAAAASLVVALVVGVIAVRSTDDETIVPADDTGVDTTAATTSTTSTTIAAGPAVVTGSTTSEPPLDSTPVDAEPVLLERTPELVTGERYASLNLGVELEFTLPRDDLFIAYNEPGIVVLIDGFEDGTYVPETGVALGLARWAGWSTREEAALRTASASIDPNDIDGWIAANDIVVLSDETREVGDKPARVIDVTVDPDSDVQAPNLGAGGCTGGWEPCFHMGADTSDSNIAQRRDWVSAQRITRLYLVPIDGSEPLLISVGAAPDSTWFDEVESTFIETLDIGPDRPPVGQN